MSELSGKTNQESIHISEKQGWWLKILNAGVRENQFILFSDKLRARNILAVLCGVFSFIYALYFTRELQLIPLTAMLAGIGVFYLCIYFNHLGKYSLSSTLLLLNTNYCVLFFSVYLGFDSGIHLYLFTSPLIILALFDIRNYRFLFLAMSSYTINFILIIFIGKYLGYQVIQLESATVSMFYLVNFSFCMLIVGALTLNFYRNNKNVNYLLILKNRELELQQKALEKENRARQITEEKIRTMQAQKEVLLTEIHHRVKNNLAVISGLMELQSFFMKDRQSLEIFRESKGRVKAMALLFEKVYENKTLERVNLNAYVDELAKFIAQVFASQKKNITVNADIISDCSLKIEAATPVALILYELITASYKYGFTDQAVGKISVSFLEYNRNYILNYTDDGMAQQLRDPEDSGALGINLIDSFCRQLNGKYEFREKEKGVAFTLYFPAV